MSCDGNCSCRENGKSPTAVFVGDLRTGTIVLNNAKGFKIVRIYGTEEEGRALVRLEFPNMAQPQVFILQGIINSLMPRELLKALREADYLGKVIAYLPEGENIEYLRSRGCEVITIPKGKESCGGYIAQEIEKIMNA